MTPSARSAPWRAGRCRAARAGGGARRRAAAGDGGDRRALARRRGRGSRARSVWRTRRPAARRSARLHAAPTMLVAAGAVHFTPALREQRALAVDGFRGWPGAEGPLAVPGAVLGGRRAAGPGWPDLAFAGSRRACRSRFLETFWTLQPLEVPVLVAPAGGPTRPASPAAARSRHPGLSARDARARLRPAPDGAGGPPRRRGGGGLGSRIPSPGAATPSSSRHEAGCPPRWRARWSWQ